MTAEEISKIKIKSLRDGHSWLQVIRLALQKQVDAMLGAYGNDDWRAADAEHYDLIQQKRRIQKDMAKFVKVKSGQK